MNSIVYILLIILNITIIIFITYAVYALIKGAPFLPSGKKKVKNMLKLANLKPADILMDLGSGDGRILFAASPKIKQAIGIEINPILFWWSKLWRVLKRKNNVIVKRQDLWKTDLSNVDVLTIFFIQDKMERLEKKIKAEMKPGSRIISNTFTFPDWQEDVKDGNIRLYIIH